MGGSNDKEKIETTLARHGIALTPIIEAEVKMLLDLFQDYRELTEILKKEGYFVEAKNQTKYSHPAWNMRKDTYTLIVRHLKALGLREGKVKEDEDPMSFLNE